MDNTRYPIGTQTFRILRERNCAYVDKTSYVYELAHSASRIYFLSRPRRFGKSLLLSTLESYFQGDKDLFEGLDICRLESEWHSYPVLHLDFSALEGSQPDAFDRQLKILLQKTASKFQVSLDETNSVGEMFGSLIERVAHVTGDKVVILIDEYDKGIVEVLEDARRLTENQALLRPFFAQIKSQDANIRFCFITGVARFRHYTIFSGFNSPDDISLDRKYAAICGITEAELHSYFKTGIEALAENIGQPYDQVVDSLRIKYDNYRFSQSDVTVYNPFSILNCLSKSQMSNYWLSSGTSKVFVKYLENSNFDVTDIEDLWVTKEEMEGIFSTENPIPLLFQTGYLTIKDFKSGLYRLGIPNGEVRRALVDELLPNYMGVANYKINKSLVTLSEQVASGDVDGLLKSLQAFVAKVPYHQFDYSNVEKTYHLIIYQIFLMLGIDTRSEISVSGGRIDMVAETERYVYVMEFKLGGTPTAALQQIDSKGYALSWAADDRKVYKIGVVFSPDTHNISDWQIE